MGAPFPIDAVLTAIAIAYHNRSMIADQILPRVPVGKEEFKYWKYKLTDGFTIPDTKVGRKSRPNQVEFDAIEVTASTEDYGLDDPIPQSDILNAPENYDPLQRSTEQTMNLIELDREVRTANMVFDAANYAAANKIVLAGNSQFSDFANSSPIAVIKDAQDAMVMPGNVLTLGQQVWNKISQHPDIVKATHGNSGDTGIASRQAVAELFELEEILVGASWVNTAKKGQNASLSRAWGKHMALTYRDTMADNNRGTTFGFTAQFGDRIAGAEVDRNIGLRGGQMVRVGESVKEVITANDLGYFIQNAVG